MKTNAVLLRLALSLISIAAPAADPITESFQKALFEEEANQNLGAAIKAYEAVIEATDTQRRLAATAVFRLGECYRKLGQTNAAIAQYQRLLRDYVDQTNLVTLSHQNLAGLGLSTPPAAAPALSLAARTEQKRLLEQEIKLTEQQLLWDKQRAESGQVSRSDVLAREREVLALRRQLAALDVGPATASVPDVDDAGTNQEDKEIRRIQALIQNSPDLIRISGAGNTPTPLMIAAQKGQLAVARFLLGAKADVNAQPDGQTALHWAVAAGQKSMAELLLTNGAKVNVQDKSGRSPLFTAAEKGYRAVAEVLLEHQADVNLKDSAGRTPLFAAAQAGQADVAELLLSRGAEVNTRDKEGATPLHLAANPDSETVAAVLLKQKAAVDATDNAGRTPLAYAVEQGRAKTTELLLKAGADAALKFGGLPLLHRAIGQGRPDLLKLLLTRKPDLEATDSSGFTPLQLAVTRHNVSGATEAVQLLLEAGADPNRPFSAVGNSRMVPPNTAPQLDTTGCSPLVVASFLGNTVMVKSLLAHGANMNARSSDGMTPLLYAVQKQSLPMLEAILAAKPDLETRSRNGYSALALAIGSSELKIAEKLTQAGADVNAALPPEPEGGALLHLAVRMGKASVELLLTNKASVNVVNRQGQTPLDLAQDLAGRSELPRREIYQGVAALLIKHGADEKFTLRSRIEVGRGAQAIRSRVFIKGTNDWNRYTLLELIAVAYADPQAVPASSPPFPDLSRVTIARLGQQGAPARSFTVDVATMLSSGDCTNAPWLEWGDLVDIPEEDHPVNERWQGLSPAVRKALTTCLRRSVEIVIKGESRMVELTPRFSIPNMVPGPSPQPGTGAIPQNVFRLNEVLRGSGLLRVSSDLSRMRVKRNDPMTGKPVEWIVNCSSNAPYDARPDLWLRDGDVIEVPEK